MPPSVSINLCCYNSEKYLRETLDSIVAQTYKDWELVIINDGSTDSTECIIQEYIAQGHPIAYYYQENKGLGYSRNEALKRSKGKYVAFIDHDDLWMPEKLLRQVHVFDNDPGTGFIYSNYYKLFEIKNRNLTLALKNKQPHGMVFERFLANYPVCVSTIMIRKESLDKLEHWFDTNLHLAEEYDVMMRFLYLNKASYISDPLSIYRIHSNMYSTVLRKDWPTELQFVMEKLSHMEAGFNDKFKAALKTMRRRIIYIESIYYMSLGKKSKARQLIYPVMFCHIRYLLIYLITYTPKQFWFFLRSIWPTSIY